MRAAVFTMIVAMLAVSAFAYDVNRTYLPELDRQLYRKVVNVPDVGEFKTLKCDFHMHTVFSDGVVWPDVRVMEAWRDGLDAIAITDHLEKHPRKPNITGDDNSSYDIALPTSQAYDMLLIKASEITRDMPHGHYNALFVTDSAALDVPDFFAAVEAAVKQGAFVQWNHSGWVKQQPEVTVWQDVAQDLAGRGWLKGVEVFNSSDWYPVALGWCIEKNLAVIAGTDMHGLTNAQYDTERSQRPMTLVFAREKSLDGIREALFAARTAAWFSDQIAGRKEFLEPLFKNSVSAAAAHFVDKDGVRRISVTNQSDLTFCISGAGAAWNGSTRLEPRATNIIAVPGTATSLPITITNLHTNLNETLATTLEIAK
ncbi:MAG TPA: hypothetical protein VMZ06_16765 [Candidatus Bathyarchaeia archaeon]|nr:hypothetical protein [Candidatus Bathyarchaeia archaeon]